MVKMAITEWCSVDDVKSMLESDPPSRITDAIITMRIKAHTADVSNELGGRSYNSLADVPDELRYLVVAKRVACDIFVTLHPEDDEMGKRLRKETDKTLMNFIKTILWKTTGTE